MSLSETIGRDWRGFLGQLADLLVPPRCVVCHQGGEWLCAECLSGFAPVQPPVCSCCGDSVPAAGLCSRCQADPLGIEGISSLYTYTGALRDVVHDYKYNGITVLASTLGRTMARHYEGIVRGVDLIVPVPLHQRRVRDRGYNQSALLAYEMADQLGVSVDDHSLVRRRSTRPQVELDASERRVNVQDAFVWVGAALTGQRVLLVDDVCTTGATLEACAVALHASGASVVRAVTLARAPQQ